MLRSRRIALVAAVVVLGLSACGDATSTTTAGNAPKVIHIGAQRVAENAAAPSAGATTSDKMMRPFGSISYVFDGAYPDLGTSGAAYQIPAGGTADPATVAKLAALLGVKGEVRTLPADQGGGFQVGAADYSGANLTVGTDGLLSWWYNPAPSAIDTGCVAIAKPVEAPVAGAGSDSSAGSAGGTAAVAPPDTIAVDPGVTCAAPPPPTNVPTKAEAEASTRQFLTGLGLDPAQYSFTSYADDYSANVTAWLMLGGHRSPIQINIGYGGEGAMMWASGSLATPQPAGDYPIVTAQEALGRLSDTTGRWSFYGAPFAMKAAGGVMATDAAVSTGGGSATVATATVSVDPAVEPAVTPAVGAPEPAPVCDPAADCVVSPGPSPDPITVHLNGVRLDLTMVWDADGAVWLLPAYTFTSADGGEFTVVAVDDSLLDLPDTSTPTPDTSIPWEGTIPAPVPADTVVVGPNDTAVPVPVPGGGLGTVPPDFSLPPVGEPTADSAALLVGLSVDEATKVADSNGWVLRVSTLDGESQILTADLNTSRINVAVTAGVVTGIDSIG